MNFLPLVFTFLLILGTFSFHFISGQRMQLSETEALAGHLRAMRLVYNEVDAQRCKKKGSDDSPKKADRITPPPDSKTEKKEEMPYFRLTRMGSHFGTINLHSFIQNRGNHKQVMYNLAYEYLKQVYAKASFFKDQPKLIKTLLDFLIEEETKAYFETNSYIPFCELKPTDQLEPFYFKLLRGTNSCDPIKQQGYFALENCITFDAKSPYVINFHFANPAHLNILFGNKTRQKIQEMEWPMGRARKGKRFQKYALEMTELRQLLGEESQTLLELIEFEYRKHFRLPQKATDPKTNISADLLNN